jgi:quinol monooxygenase YgiN
MTVRLAFCASIAVLVLAACSHSCPPPATPAPAPAPAAEAPIHEAGAIVGFVIRFTVLPGQKDAAEKLIHDTAQKVRDTEPGTLVYLFSHPSDAPDDVVVIEVYADQASQRAHGEGPAMTAAMPQLASVFDMSKTRADALSAAFDGFVR